MRSVTHPPVLPIARAPLAASLLLPLAGSLSAQTDEWRWEVTPYAWATDVHVDARLPGRGAVSGTIPVEDLIEDLDLTFQGRVEAQRGVHGISLDVFYVSMSDQADGFPLPGGAGSGDLDWRLDMTIADVAGSYDPRGDRKGFSLLYGARIVDQRAEADTELTTTSGTSQQHDETSDTLVDVLVGVRYRAELTRRLSVQARVEASTGGTESTWSAFPALSYAFNDRCTLVAGYRYLAVDFEDEGDLDMDLSLSGPLVGLSLSF